MIRVNESINSTIGTGTMKIRCIYLADILNILTNKIQNL
jgi:hypothetical protein